MSRSAPKRFPATTLPALKPDSALNPRVTFILNKERAQIQAVPIPCAQRSLRSKRLDLDRVPAHHDRAAQKKTATATTSAPPPPPSPSDLSEATCLP